MLEQHFNKAVEAMSGTIRSHVTSALATQIMQESIPDLSYPKYSP